MQLKYIELQGFKSFPDKTVIAFGDGITAIVGPNGSGKSNISDAVRWVMGETSSKTLRGQKMEDVIFDGTTLRKPMGFAEVSLVLDNSDRTLPLEYDEVAITRRYYRSGESEYFINRSDVRLRDIQELLRDTGLGKTGYSIIGQGAITEIIGAKSADRRVLFEEAAGIAKFKYKKDESLRRLNQTQNNIVRLTDIVSELQARLGPLESQAQKAKQYLALRDEKKGLEVTLWVHRLTELARQADEASQLVQTFSQDLQNAVSELQKTESQITEALACSEQLTAQIEQIRAFGAAQAEQIAEQQTQIVVAQNDIEHAQKDIERLRKTKQENAGQSQQIQAQRDEKQTRLDEAQQQLSAFDVQLDQYEQALKQLEDQAAALQQKMTEAQDRLTELSQRDTLLRVEFSSVEQSTHDQAVHIQGRKQEISDAQERFGTLEAEREQLQSKKDSLQKDLDSAKNIQAGYLVKKQQEDLRVQQARTAFLQSQTTYGRQTDRLHILQGMQQHYEGFQNSIKTVMEESRKGVLTGVEGTVADLIEVDEEYATAIETALGGSLQHIVTDSEQSSKNCIYYLKNKNAGRATFLPVSNIHGKRLDPIPRAGENGVVGLAADLVRFDARYRGIMDYLLGRTVVCEDMDSATRLARQNKYAFRVVTLDGQLVNVGGSLTGGSSGRKFGILSRHNEIEDLKKECAGLKEQMSRDEQQVKRLEQQLQQTESDLSHAQSEIRLLEEEQIKTDAALNHCISSLQTIRQQEESLKKELENLSLQSRTHLEQREVLTGKLEENDAAILAQKEVCEMLRQQQAALGEEKESRMQQLQDCRLQRLEYEKDLESEKQQLSVLEQQLQTQSASSEQLDREIEGLEQQIVVFTEKIDALQAQKAQLQQQTAQNEEEILNKVAQRTQTEQQIQQLRESEKGLYEQREKLSAQLERQTHLVQSAEEEKQTIISKIWDEYELPLSQAQQLCVPIEDFAAAQRKVNAIKASMRALGEINLTAVEEYTQVKERYDGLWAQVQDLTKSKESIEKMIAELTEQMTTVFTQQFAVINAEFERVFRQLFNGGSAKLTLDDPENVLESGIEIYVAPPGKIIKHLSSLSGGEQSLTAIALYFAILTIRPAPFCLLDEIEAALDDVNVVRYAEYLRKHEHTQFIVITHRRGTMEAADRLYGVTMKEKGISRILAIDVSQIEKHI